MTVEPNATKFRELLKPGENVSNIWLPLNVLWKEGDIKTVVEGDLNSKIK
jgi:hypothetical protein